MNMSRRSLWIFVLTLAASCGEEKVKARTWSPEFTAEEAMAWGERCGPVTSDYPSKYPGDAWVRGWGHDLPLGKVQCTIRWMDGAVHDMHIVLWSTPGQQIDPEILRTYVSFLAERLAARAEATLQEVIPSRAEPERSQKIGALTARSGHAAYRDATEMWTLTLTR